MALKSEEDRPAYGSFKNTKTRRNRCKNSLLSLQILLYFFSFTRVSQPVPVERSPPRSESPPAKPFTLADDYEFTSDEDLERDWADDDIEDSVLEEISILGLNLKRSYGKYPQKTVILIDFRHRDTKLYARNIRFPEICEDA